MTYRTDQDWERIAKGVTAERDRLREALVRISDALSDPASADGIGPAACRVLIGVAATALTPACERKRGPA